ncbi:MAG: hypothetical protein HQK53_01100 [Oligoflexia bacterium]|nr:hypothetical protein [Oligoflexia bacterium]
MQMLFKTYSFFNSFFNSFLNSEDLVTKLFFLWTVVLIFASIVLSQTNHTSSSNDSRFYSELVEEYHDKNWKEIIAPKWGDNYGERPDSLMRDQFPGQLLLGVAVSKLGVPPKHALHVVQMFFQVATIFLLFQIATFFIGKTDALVLFYGLLLIPTAFSYNIRGNHESGIAFFMVLSLLSGIKLNQNSKRWIFIGIFCAVTLLLIKGPFAIFSPVLFSLGYFFRTSKQCPSSPTERSLYILTVVLSVFFVILTALGYEFLYRLATNESMLEEFYRKQFMERAFELRSTYPFLIQKLVNLYFYLDCCVTYALPWIIFVPFILFIKKFKFKKIAFLNSKLSWLLILASFLLCFVCSIPNRLAARYVYPAYYLFAAWSILFAYFNLDFLRRLHQNILAANALIPLVVILWLIAFIVHLI